MAKQAKFYQVDLDLFEQELIIVPRYFDGKYSLLYQAPNYFPDVILKVWEYNKEIVTDSPTEIDLTSITNQLQTINNSLNLILDLLNYEPRTEPPNLEQQQQYLIIG